MNLSVYIHCLLHSYGRRHFKVIGHFNYIQYMSLLIMLCLIIDGLFNTCITYLGVTPIMCSPEALNKHADALGVQARVHEGSGVPIVLICNNGLTSVQ